MPFKTPDVLNRQRIIAAKFSTGGLPLAVFFSAKVSYIFFCDYIVSRG